MRLSDHSHYKEQASKHWSKQAHSPPPPTKYYTLPMHLLLFLLSTLVPFAFSSPLALYDSDQVILDSPSITHHHKYKNGELPPTNDTQGWVDPRLNGGRLLDVRIPVSVCCGVALRTTAISNHAQT